MCSLSSCIRFVWPSPWHIDLSGMSSNSSDRFDKAMPTRSEISLPLLRLQIDIASRAQEDCSAQDLLHLAWGPGKERRQSISLFQVWHYSHFSWVGMPLPCEDSLPGETKSGVFSACKERSIIVLISQEDWLDPLLLSLAFLDTQVRRPRP